MSDVLAQNEFTPKSRFLKELMWRGMFNQCTDLKGLDEHLAAVEPAGAEGGAEGGAGGATTAGGEAWTGGRRAYIGFDPTADSLTIGNLVQIMVLAHFQRAGHTPIVLLGGATGLIGDPSGKSAERTLSDKATVDARVQAQRRIFGSVLKFEGGAANAARIVNNIDWWGPKTFLDVLRDVGKHFSVNRMIQKDSVRDRLNSREQGISYTEFSYMILQSFDYAHLYGRTFESKRVPDVTLQMGASDQWGNIVEGVDLIRRIWIGTVQRMMRADRPELLPKGSDFDARMQMAEGDLSLPADKQAFGLTTHLLTKADGGKFGKTEKGAVWLTAPSAGDSSPNRTTPYALYQYLLNLADADCGKFLRIFTFLTQAQVLDIEARHAADPGQRLAQRTIARSMVGMLHGAHEAEASEAAARALFSGEIASLPEATLREVLGEAPASKHDRARLGGDGADLVELLVETGLATSKKQAREFLGTGAVTINGQASPADGRLRESHLLHGSMIAIRRGKKNWHVTTWE